MLIRRLIVFAFAIATLVAKSGLAAPVDPERIVVMISVDGLAGHYLDDPKAEMPTIRELAKTGARAKSMKASTPTVTWPNHTTLVTGVPPAKHGVTGNNYFDRAANRKVTLIADPEFDKEQIVRVPTIYDVAKKESLKTAAIRWPATRNAKTLDWTMPDVASEELTKRYTTPALVTECEQAGIEIFSGNRTLAKQITARDHPDDTYTKIFNLILRSNRPNLALLHIANVDHEQHMHGPNSTEAYQAIKEADGQVREVWECLKQNFSGKATLLIVSDHGFSPIKRSIFPNVILRKAGLIQESKQSTNTPIAIIAQGGSAFIYVKDQANRSEVLSRISKAMKGVEGISKIVHTGQFKNYGVADPKDDPHAPDMILFAEEGNVFGDTASGSLPFEDKPERRGSHGHDPNLPDLHATFVAWGAGIKSGTRLGEISNTSVAPTIARLLKVSLPGAEGKPLTRALTD
jgi:predicted AlkP superfamily pyrophosphatase or phosphodiesterase